MGVAAAAVVADLAGPELVPGLGHVQHHAVLVERLEGEGDVGGDLREEARVRVAVGVERLLAVLVELAHRDLAEDAQPLAGVVVEACRATGDRWSAPSPGCGWRGCRCSRTGRRRRPGRSSCTGCSCCARRRRTGRRPRSRSPGGTAPVRERLALVEARRADQAERRPFRQVLRQLAVVGQRRQLLRLVDAVDALVGHERPRPLLVVLRVVLDQQHLRPARRSACRP